MCFSLKDEVSKRLGVEVSVDDLERVLGRACRKFCRIVRHGDSDYDYDERYFAQLVAEALIESTAERIYNG